MIPINVTSCLSNLTTNTPDILVFTSNKIIEKKEYIKNVNRINSVVNYLSVNNLDPFNDGSLIAYYKLDGNANDSLGNYNSNSTLNYTNSKFNLGVNSGNISLGFNLTPLNVFTISFFVISTKNLSSDDGAVLIFKTGNTSIHHQFLFRTLNKSKTFGLNIYDYPTGVANNIVLGKNLYPDQNGIVFDSETSITQWNNLVASLDINGTFRYYVNGILKGEVVNTSNWYLNVSSLNVWISQNNNNNTIILDNVQIFNRSLNQTEINLLSNMK